MICFAFVIHIIIIKFPFCSEMTAYFCTLCVLFDCLVCCVAVKNCLECRQRNRDRRNKSSIPNNHKTQEIILNAVTSSKVRFKLVGLLVPKNRKVIAKTFLFDLQLNRVLCRIVFCLFFRQP